MSINALLSFNNIYVDTHVTKFDYMMQVSNQNIATKTKTPHRVIQDSL